jgi:CheY-like chemotaxis protein
MKTIIFADDDPGIQDAFRIIFNKAEYELVIYADGSPLLQNNFAVPDMFILDKQLSGVDGLEICRFLKSQERTKHIPVIMLSASPFISNLAKAAGADDFLEKPFRMKMLREMVAGYLNQ